MPRPLRLQLPDTWYHIVNRGKNHQNIFLSNAHFGYFLERLSICSEKYKIQIHAYCLMSNHFHILLKTKDPNLAVFMRNLTAPYVKKFNQDLNGDGPMFKSRYSSTIIDSNEYLLRVSRYIHLNPSEANMVDDPLSYPWSSLQFYKDPSTKPAFLKTSPILDQFLQIKDYANFVNLGVDKGIKSFYNPSQIKPILGSKKFIEDIYKKLS